MDDRTRAALERAAAAAERRKKELEGKQLDAKQPEADARQRTESKPAEGTRRVAPPPPATPSPVLAVGDPKADDAEAPADAVVEVQPEFDAPLEVAFDDVEPPASRWKVGDTVLAQWSDDHLFYKAVIKVRADSRERFGPPLTLGRNRALKLRALMPKRTPSRSPSTATSNRTRPWRSLWPSPRTWHRLA